jgi:hypothetical protein
MHRRRPAFFVDMLAELDESLGTVRSRHHRRYFVIGKKNSIKTGFSE